MNNLNFWPVCAGLLLVIAPALWWLMNRRYPQPRQAARESTPQSASAPARLTRHETPTPHSAALPELQQMARRLGHESHERAANRYVREVTGKR